MTEIHGHRGFRGLYPENSIKGFIEAKKAGAHAIELDLVLTKDLKLVVNHDPWLKSGNYMINKLGHVPEYDVNLYEKDLIDIQQYALGTKRNLKFSNQIPFPHQIPSFEEVILHPDLQDVFWNIEVKSDEKWYGIHQIHPKEYATLVHEFIIEHRLINNCLVQAFDTNILNELNQLNPTYPLGFLVENQLGFEKNLDRLNFKPDFYNPDEVLVNKTLINQVHSLGIRCLVWTVNDNERAQELIDWEVDGLITDYPNLFLK